MNSENTQSLTVLDNRTNKLYQIPIVNNTISALKIKEINADPLPGAREEDDSGKGLKYVLIKSEALLYLWLCDNVVNTITVYLH